MGPKLDFVREDVPNVRSLTFLSFICSYATFSPFLFSPPATTLILTPLSLSFSIFFSPPLSLSLSLRSLDCRAFLPRRGFFVLPPSFRAEIPVSPETLDDVASLLHVPRYYAYFTDFYGIPRRLLPPAPPSSRPPLFCSSSISITSMLYFFLRSLALFSFLRFPPSLFSYCPLCTHPSHSPFVGGVFLSCGATCVSLTILRSCPRDCGFGLQAQIFLLFPSSDQPSINTSVRRKSFHICKFYI